MEDLSPSLPLQQQQLLGNSPFGAQPQQQQERQQRRVSYSPSLEATTRSSVLSGELMATSSPTPVLALTTAASAPAPEIDHGEEGSSQVETLGGTSLLRCVGMCEGDLAASAPAPEIDHWEGGAYMVGTAGGPSLQRCVCVGGSDRSSRSSRSRSGLTVGWGGLIDSDLI